MIDGRKIEEIKTSKKVKNLKPSNGVVLHHPNQIYQKWWNQPIQMILLILKIIFSLFLTGAIYYLLRSVSKLKKQLSALKNATLMSNINDLKDLCKYYGLTDKETEFIINVYNLHININSLHRNQTVLSSSIKELYRELKRHDKSFKQRQVRVDHGTQKEGPEES
jgi:hypothetical protein